MQLIQGLMKAQFLESMIWSGAFDCFGLKRSQLNATYDKIVARIAADRKTQGQGQTSLFDGLLNDDKAANKTEYPNIPEYSTDEKLQLEKTVLGVYISGHPLDPYRNELSTFSFNSSMLEGQEVYGESGEVVETIYTNLKDHQKVETGGIVTEIKKLSTKTSNKDMAIITVEDLFGQFDVMLFNKQYETYKNKLKENLIVKIKGEVSLRENETPIIFLNELSVWNLDKDTGAAFQDIKKLYLKFDTQNTMLQSKIESVLKRYPGQIEVKARCSSTGKAVLFPEKVDGSNGLVSELIGLLDENSVKLL